MSEETMLPAVQSTKQVSVTEIELSATNPKEMMDSQKALINWCERKLASLRFDAEELKAAVEHAKKNRWNRKTLLRHHNLAVKRIAYYEKMLAAFQAGFILVPNFPLEIFAIKTTREFPKRLVTFYRYGTHEQTTDFSAQGEGEYKNPNPAVRCDPDNKEKNSKTGEWETKPKYFTAGNFEEIDFPISMAKPHIMELVSEAMAMKIFDEIGILPSVKRNIDPVICGMIKIKEHTYEIRTVTFMIAWHIDTRVL